MSTAHHIRYGSEAELRHMLLEYQAILDNASVGIVFTRNRTFLHCSARFSEMFGWPVDELIGQPTHIVYPSMEAYDELGRSAIPVLSAGKRLDIEVQMKRRDGSVFWCRMLAKAIDPNDHGKGTIFITEDISERKAADEARRQLLLEYQAILDNASLGITFTRNRTFLHCNERFSEMFGWSANELVGQSTTILYPSREAFEELSRIATPTLSAGRRLDVEVLMKKRDGTLFWCRMLANAIDPNDHGKGSIFITEDISERKQADEARRQLLLEYQAILDNATLGITFTRKRIFLHCNARFSEMFGWGSNELVGQSAAIVYPSPEAFSELSSKVSQALADGARFETELQMKRRDGSLFWCRMLARAIDPNDSSKGSIFITEDITERRAVQDALIRARDELELRVQERTAELAEANMRLQQEIQERRVIEEQVRHLANHDALTDLPNRRLLEDRLAQALAGAKRNGGQVAVLFIDLDYFKPINDSHGHRIGDLMLQAIAKRLRGLLREVDTVARVGGDEFIVVLPDIHSPEAAGETAQRILDAMIYPYTIEGNQLSVTPSMGISLYPGDGTEVTALLDRADEAMYHAKQAGRQNFQYYCKIPQTTAD
ncbi:MAG TPA: diguanylate cyclase [Paucimonas sp.]|nr:diguanylate cyclase [Paucimonas sp.]